MLVGGIVAVPLLGLAGRGVTLLGEVPQGLPAPGLPAIQASDLNTLLPLAMACFLLGAVETAAIGRMFARKHGYRLDSNQEFLALAGANLASGLGQRLPGERRHVAVARQRGRGRAHARSRASSPRGDPARGRPLLRRACCATCRSPCSRPSC